MRIRAIYSHLNGYEHLVTWYPGLWSEVRGAIHGVDASALKTKDSKEKGRGKGKVYAPKEINAAFHSQLSVRDWSERRTPYLVASNPELIKSSAHLGAKEIKAIVKDLTTGAYQSYNQTDFVKEKVAVEVQFGKYSFISYDLFVKHLTFYVQGVIDVGIEIVPMKTMQAQMSSGPGYYEWALTSLLRQGRGVPAVPLLLIGVDDLPQETDDELRVMLRGA